MRLAAGSGTTAGAGVTGVSLTTLLAYVALLSIFLIVQGLFAPTCAEIIGKPLPEVLLNATVEIPRTPREYV